MAKKVKIILTSEQTSTEIIMNDDGEQSVEENKNNTVVECEGTIRRSGDKFYIEYEETELTGMEGSTTQLFFPVDDPSSVTMSRNGSVQTVLTFRGGERYISAYDTPYGSFEVTVVTLSSDNTVDFSGGEINIEYQIEIHGAVAEKNTINIKVKVIEDEI